MYVLAVTGGLGAGKTTATDFLRSRGAVVLSLDDIAKHQLAPGTPVFDQVVAAFGPVVLDEDGRIDTDALAREAFSSAERARELNAIVHPAVLREVAPGLTEMGLLPNPPRMVAIDIPLLVEAPVFGELVDEVVTISAPEEVRIERAVSRGMSEADARARIACQATDAEREAVADHVIVNDSTLEEFHERLTRFWDDVIDDAS